MSTPKARYAGTTPRVTAWSEQLRTQIRKHFPDQTRPRDQSEFAAPADAFVEVILSAANFAMSDVGYLKLRSTKAELQAEQQDVMKALKVAKRKVDQLSIDLVRLLGQGGDQNGCSEAIDLFCTSLCHAEQEIKKLKPAKLAGAQHAIAFELAVRVLTVMKDYRLSIAATGSAVIHGRSAAIAILKAIGDELRLRLSDHTWRDIIANAKRDLPNLKQ